jgi:hypothetical protein
MVGLPHPFKDDGLYLDWCSKVNGWGVFSKRMIMAGDYVEVAPVIVYPKAFIDTAIWVAQGDGMKDEDYMLDRYSLSWDRWGVAIPLGWLGLYNHSDNPNSMFVSDTHQKLLGMRAIKDIYPDQQITVSYGKDWFSRKPYIKKAEL